MKRYFILVAFFSLFQVQHGISQCSFFVNASASPEKVCGTGGTITLTGTNNASNICEEYWTPTTGLANPNSAVTSATVNTSTTYTYTVKAKTNNNVIVNGDFESGNTGFSSQYTYIPPVPSPTIPFPPSYTVITSPAIINSNFPPCADHTTGSGNLLLVNSINVTGLDVWCQTVSINPSSDYVFEMWLGGLGFTAPDVTVTVGGIPLGSVMGSAGQCNWVPYTENWTNSGLSSVEICVSVNTASFFGPAFGLDDISFSEICTDSESVFVEVVDVQSVIAPTSSINCNDLTADLNGSASSSGPNISYQWSTVNGQILGAANQNQAVAGQGGEYFLTVLYDDGLGFTCSDTESIIVVEDKNQPVASAVVSGTLDCQNPTLQIDGTGSSQGGNFSYDWSTTDGNFVSGTFGLTPTVDQSGTYQLIVTNSDNGCKDTTDVFVDALFLFPNADVIASGIITCPNPTVQLDASGSTPAGVAFFWSTVDGQFISGTNTLTPTVGSTGTYQIIVQDNSNGCRDTADVFVQENRIFPTADAITFDILNCFTPEIDIDGTASSQGPNFTYQWSTPNGNIVSGANSLTPTVNQGGIYQIIVTDNVGGCKDTAETFVTADLFPPFVSIRRPDSLKCGSPTILIDGSSSDSGLGYILTWGTTNGAIVGSIDSTHLEVSAPGDYFLSVMDELNGCRDTAYTEVFGAGGSLSFSVLPVDSLDCETSTVIIDASQSSHDSIYKFSWRTDNGNFFSGDTTLMPVVDAGGDYWLRITDTLNMCSDSIKILIKQDTLHPLVDGGSPRTFLCRDDSIQLYAVILNPDTNFVFNWGSMSGNILSGDSTLSPWVGSSGDFFIIVKDSTNKCEARDTVFVIPDSDLPIATISLPDTLTCNIGAVLLDATGSDSGPGFTFGWSTSNGNFSTPPVDLQPTVNQTGSYELLIENTSNGCKNTAIIEVYENLDTPDVTIILPDTITCFNEEVTINSMISGNPLNYSINWSTSNGNILSGISGNSILVNSEGDYFLEVINNSTGCRRLVQTEVFENKIIPDYTLNIPDTIDCINSQVDISAIINNPNGNFIFEWQPFPNGSILGANNMSSVQVDSAGTYLVRSTETETGCLSERLVDVEDNFAFPQISILPFDSINCLNDSVRIEGIAQSIGGPLQYEWISANGVVLGSPDGFSIYAGETGDYTWTVTDIESGCQTDTVISVTGNQVFPQISIALPDTLGCSLTPIFLNANGSSSGPNFQLNWSTSTGNILSGVNSLTPEINAEGTYYLEILNSSNVCSVTDSISVVSNSSITGLGILLSGSDTINCYQPTLTATTITGNYTYEWTNASNPNPGNWTETVLLNSPGLVTVEVTAPDGCKGQTSVEIFDDFERPMAEAGSTQQLSCSVDSLFLNGVGSFGPQYSYQWTTTNGNIRSGQNSIDAVIGSAGTYYFTVLNTRNGCKRIDSVEITASTDLPFGFIQPAPVYNCIQKSFELDASSSDSGTNFQYNWSTPDGNIVSGSTGLTPQVDSPGNYFLEILNTDNNCKTTLNAIVVADTLAPDANAGIDTLINCFHPEIRLGATVNSPRTDFRFDWQTTSGNIIQDGDTPQPLINAQGEYTVLVFDLINGCEKSVSVNVAEDFSKPNGTPLPTDILTCTDTIVPLEVQIPGTPEDYDFIWNTSTGRFAEVGDTSVVTADIGGDFTVEIIQLSNGCRDTVDFTIQESKQLPDIAVNALSSINCDNSTVEISGVGSSSGNGISYLWTTSSGQIISGQNQLNAIAGLQGFYTLTVSNSISGCKDTATVLVEIDTIRPLIVLSMPDTLTCDIEELNILSSVGNASIPEFTWTTNSGNILSGQSTNEILINQPGFYFVEIKNLANGCTSKDSVNVVQNDIPPVINIEVPDSLTCSQTVVLLDASGSSTGGQFAFEWSTQNGNIMTGGNGLNPSIDSVGTYVFTIENIFTGCLEKDSVEVFEVPNSLTEIILTTVRPGCDNDLGTVQIEEVLGGIPPLEFSIDQGLNFGSDNLFEDLITGGYQITVRDLNGCELATSVQLDLPDSLILTDLPDLILSAGQSSSLNVEVNRDSSELSLIEWSPSEGLSCTDCLNPILTFQTAQIYTVLVRDDRGCEGQISFRVESSEEIEIYFPTAFSPNGDTYNDLFKGFAAPGVISNYKTLQIYDRWGNKIFQSDNGDPLDPNFGWDGTFRGNTLDSGVYVFWAEIELSTGETKLFKGDITILSEE